MTNDTICALATPVGGAIAIIRISGEQSLEILSHVFKSRTFSPTLIPSMPARSIHYGIISDNSSSKEDIIDEVLVSVFQAPHSYTGEDSAEISCHGSRYVTAKILELLIVKGARQANPGEFTQRAFLNGKMDLSQAEAVADLIASSNRATHQIAISQLRGQFSSELSQLRDKLLHLTSLLELELDFSDHEDLEFADRSKLLSLAIQIDERITALASSFQTGQALKNGIPVAIVGKTNVGKSTLLNRLLRDERAIVSDIHGTTRDTIEDTMEIRGVTFRFIDTAGIRQTSDEVEQIGIQRTFSAIERARIVLWLIDAEPSATEVQEMQNRCADKSLLIVRNKIDLAEDITNVNVSASDHIEHSPSSIEHSPSYIVHSTSSIVHNPSSIVHRSSSIVEVLNISAKYDTNLDALEAAIYEAANIPTLTDSDIIVTSARHYEALIRAHDSITRVIEGLGAKKVNSHALMSEGENWSIVNAPLSEDLIAEDLRLTLSHLADITGGAITPQDTLNNIFSHFCVGK